MIAEKLNPAADLRQSKFIPTDEFWPFREVYYSAFDLSVYHTCLNCSEGQVIPKAYLRRAYSVSIYAYKCPQCEYLENTAQGIIGVPENTEL